MAKRIDDDTYEISARERFALCWTLGVATRGLGMRGDTPVQGWTTMEKAKELVAEARQVLVEMGAL